MDEVFEFDYILEMYKPAAARRWGYYALPILYGDRLVGKLDATADRKAGVLRVAAVHRDVPFSKADDGRRRPGDPRTWRAGSTWSWSRPRSRVRTRGGRLRGSQPSRVEVQMTTTPDEPLRDTDMQTTGGSGTDADGRDADGDASDADGTDATAPTATRRTRPTATRATRRHDATPRMATAPTPTAPIADECTHSNC